MMDSFPRWYKKFKNVTTNAVIIPLPDNIIEYLENDAFVLPIEATNTKSEDSFWSDGSPVENQEDDSTTTFEEFSREIQNIINEYESVFIKCNWSSPLDAIWVAPTKTLKCQTLEEVYLLLKSSDRILKDLKRSRDNKLQPCLVLKQWEDINPCTEFRCFVIENKLVGIGQRDTSQYHPYNESEKYTLREDIENFYKNHIANKFEWCNYNFDIFRCRTNRFKIIDFGPLNETSMQNTLFNYEELKELYHKPLEFRFIGEEVGIQPKSITNFCAPREINEFYQTSNNSSIDMIQIEVEKQSLKD